MRKIKLSQLDTFHIDEAQRHIRAVLGPIKRRQLQGEALMDMKRLENSMVQLECFLIGKANRNLSL